ncbi:ABC-type transport system substrate-binding protein [Streptomyces sp. V4I23]|uniref:hypothetical protein n=1 Tax=Streptomyces sp. V4I23 TaxID=3042282 RepID=UPI00278830BF|nr:hypothetical protein [Streptomyces sp. V4I23]MDQ1007812.1 ABC-type transport system substrate-binding protein [Streptomyces sp. V4I23]
MHRSRFLHGAFVVAATSLLASACTTGAGTSAEGAGSRSAGPGGTLKVGLTSDVTTFDPVKGRPRATTYSTA